MFPHTRGDYIQGHPLDREAALRPREWNLDDVTAILCKQGGPWPVFHSIGVTLHVNRNGAPTTFHAADCVLLRCCRDEKPGPIRQLARP